MEISNNTKTNNFDALLSVCSLGTIGVLIFTLLPLILGVAAEELSLSDTQTGAIASYYFGSFFIVTLTSFFWIRRYSWKHLAYVGMGLVALGLFASVMFRQSYQIFNLMLSIVGVGAAICYCLSLAIAGDTEDKDKTFAIKLVPEQIIPAAIIFLLPWLFLENLNLIIIFTTMSVVVIFAAYFSRKTPIYSDSDEYEVSKPKANFVIILSLFSMFLVFTGFASIWAFSERIASDNVAESYIGPLLALGLITSGLGPLLAVVLEKRVSRVRSIIIGMVLSILTVIYCIGNINTATFALLMFAFPGAFYYSLSFLFGLVSDTDPNGLFTAYISSALALAAAVGPVVFGAISDQVSVSHALWFNIGFIIAGTAIAYVIELKWSRVNN